MIEKVIVVGSGTSQRTYGNVAAATRALHDWGKRLGPKGSVVAALEVGSEVAVVERGHSLSFSSKQVLRALLSPPYRAAATAGADPGRTFAAEVGGLEAETAALCKFLAHLKHKADSVVLIERLEGGLDTAVGPFRRVGLREHLETINAARATELWLAEMGAALARLAKATADWEEPAQLRLALLKSPAAIRSLEAAIAACARIQKVVVDASSLCIHDRAAIGTLIRAVVNDDGWDGRPGRDLAAVREVQSWVSGVSELAGDAFVSSSADATLHRRPPVKASRRDEQDGESDGEAEADVAPAKKKRVVQPPPAPRGAGGGCAEAGVCAEGADVGSGDVLVDHVADDAVGAGAVGADLAAEGEPRAVPQRARTRAKVRAAEAEACAAVDTGAGTDTAPPAADAGAESNDEPDAAAAEGDAGAAEGDAAAGVDDAAAAEGGAPSDDDRQFIRKSSKRKVRGAGTVGVKGKVGNGKGEVGNGKGKAKEQDTAILAKAVTAAEDVVTRNVRAPLAAAWAELADRTRLLAARLERAASALVSKVVATTTDCEAPVPALLPTVPAVALAPAAVFPLRAAPAAAGLTVAAFSRDPSAEALTLVDSSIRPLVDGPLVTGASWVSNSCWIDAVMWALAGSRTLVAVLRDHARVCNSTMCLMSNVHAACVAFRCAVPEIKLSSLRQLVVKAHKAQLKGPRGSGSIATALTTTKQEDASTGFIAMLTACASDARSAPLHKNYEGPFVDHLTPALTSIIRLVKTCRACGTTTTTQETWPMDALAPLVLVIPPAVAAGAGKLPAARLSDALTTFVAANSNGRRNSAGTLTDNGLRCATCTERLRSVSTSERRSKSAVLMSTTAYYKHVKDCYAGWAYDGGELLEFLYTAYTETRTFVHVAPILCLVFNRFGPHKKISTLLALELQVDMRPYMASAGPPVLYRLVGFLVHQGESIKHGHFIAYSRDGEDFLLSDSLTPVVKRLNASSIAGSCDAYMAIYEVLA